MKKFITVMASLLVLFAGNAAFADECDGYRAAAGKGDRFNDLVLERCEAGLDDPDSVWKPENAGDVDRELCNESVRRDIPIEGTSWEDACGEGETSPAAVGERVIDRFETGEDSGAFSEAADKLYELFEGLRGVVYALALIAFIGFAVSAMLGKLEWKKVAMLGAGLFLLSIADAVVIYVME